MKSEGAVVIGGGVTALNAVRCLGTIGIPVAVLQVFRQDIAHFSRWVCDHIKFLEFNHRPEEIVNILKNRSRKWKNWALFPTGDLALSILSQQRDYLERYYRMTVPSWEVSRMLLEKDLTYEAARQVGIDTPICYGEATKGFFKNQKISYPVVVKPLVSHQFTKHFSQKLFVARNYKELAQCIEKVLTKNVKAKIYDLIPGPDHLFFNYSVYMNKFREPVAELGMKKIRKDPPFFGVCRVGERAYIPELREPTIEILRHVQWRGMANAEYKYDLRDGKYKLMEINGRCFLMHGLARQANINYPYLALREYVSGEHKIKAKANSWQGVWIHLLKDIYYGTIYSRTEGINLYDYIKPYRRSKSFAVWSANDPVPFMVESAYAARNFASVKLPKFFKALARGQVATARQILIPLIEKV